MMKNNCRLFLLVFFLIIIVNYLTYASAKESEIYLTDEDIKNLYEAKNRTDIAILGSGPAGLSAAIFSARRGIPTYIFNGPNHLGYLKEGLSVENIPGADSDSGMNIMKKLEEQARHFGAHFIDDTIEDIDLTVWPRKLKGGKQEYSAEAIIISTGAKSKSLGIAGEPTYTYKGIMPCGLCDAHLAKDQDIIIIGGGDCAAERVFQLVPYAKSITLLVRSDAMKALPSMQRKIKDMPTVKILCNKEAVKFVGDGKHLTGVEALDKKTNKIDLLPAKWVFLSIGFIPNTALFKNHLELDEEGYIKINFATQETSVPLVYAAGNVCDPRYKLAATCIGSATQAAFNASQAITHLPITREMAEKIQHNAFIPDESDLENKIPELKDESELEKIIKDNKFVFVDFFISTCPECRRVGNILNSLASKYKDKMTFIKVEDNKFDSLSKAYDIQYVPTLMLFGNGNMIYRIQDQVTEQEIEQKILDVINK